MLLLLSLSSLFFLFLVLIFFVLIFDRNLYFTLLLPIAGLLIFPSLLFSFSFPSLFFRFTFC